MRKFANEHEKRIHVIMLNLARRHLEGWQWGQGFGMLLEEEGVATEQRSKLPLWRFAPNNLEYP